MCVIMGGSGSTGSSLVKNILNRHSDIFSGEETSFFAKKSIYDNWLVAKNRIEKRKLKGLRNFGFHIYNGTDLVHPEYLYSKLEIEELAKKSDTLIDFCEAFYKEALAKKGATIWLEKTPANSACFVFFLNHFKDGKVIHTCRDPYDTIASLWSRGYDLYYAVGLYLLNTASGLSARSFGERYYEIKYENLVKEPEHVMSNVCSFLGIQYSNEILTTKNENIRVSQLQGWNYDETSNIGKNALGRFDKMDKIKQIQIMEAVDLIEVSNIGKKLYNINVSCVRDICEKLDYEYKEVSENGSYLHLKKMAKEDRMKRLKRGYLFGVYYPLQLSY